MGVGVDDDCFAAAGGGSHCSLLVVLVVSIWSFIEVESMYLSLQPPALRLKAFIPPSCGSLSK